MTSSIHLDFHYDISCPFAYMASLQLPALQSRHPGLIINYCPVLLGALYRATSAPQGAAGSASDVFNPTKRAVTSAAFTRTLHRLGVEYRQPKKHPQKTTGALRLLFCVEGRNRVTLTASLYRAYWVDGRDVSSTDVLKGVVDGCEGLTQSTKESLSRLLDSGEFESPKHRQELERTTNLALQRGAFGVPAFWIQQEGRLYWGQDRLHFLEKALYTMEQRKDKAPPLLEELMPRYVPVSERRIPEGEEVKMEFWYDFSSPWAFLGWTQLARLRRIFGQRLKIVMKPFLLGILFREIGAPNLPMATISEAKRKYSRLDHADWCQWWNDINEQNHRLDKHIDFQWAEVFPIRTPTVLRAALVEPSLVEVLFRACWEHNKDMSSDQVLHSVIAEAGYEAESVLAKANSPEIKQDLRARTKEAKDTGICGVPSYRILKRKVGQQDQDWRLASDIIWGQDETAVVEDLISGWDGQSSITKAEKHNLPGVPSAKL